MKIFKILAGIALMNVAGVAAISSVVAVNISPAISTPQAQIIATPTPIVIIRRVVTKIYKQVAAVATPITTSLGVSNTPSPQTNNNNSTSPPTTVPATTTPPATQPPQNRCIIVIDGVQYDVTDFRNIHSGGNIFNCGTDMSAIFWSRHNAAILARMQQYRI